MAWISFTESTEQNLIYLKDEDIWSMEKTDQGYSLVVTRPDKSLVIFRLDEQEFNQLAMWFTVGLKR